jgi:hypothetical protein
METLFDLDTGAPVATPEALNDAGRAAVAERLPAIAEEGRAGVADSAGAQRGASGGGPRLDDLVAGLWEGLAARRVVECPVCSAEMHPEFGVHALPIGGRCRGCGSTLS